jgi:hypothetical protein
MSHPSRVNKLKNELLWQQDLILWKKKLTELENLHIIPCVIILWRGSGPYATKFDDAATNRSSCFIALVRFVPTAVTTPCRTWELVCTNTTGSLNFLLNIVSATVSATAPHRQFPVQGPITFESHFVRSPIASVPFQTTAFRKLMSTTVRNEMSCCLVEFYWRSEKKYSLRLQDRRVNQAASSFDLEDAGSTFCRNVCILLSHCTMSYPRRHRIKRPLFVQLENNFFCKIEYLI